MKERHDVISMRKKMKLDDERNKRMTILVELRYRFPALEAHSHRFSLPSLFFFFFRKSHADWMDAGRATSASSRFAKFVARGRIGWPSDKRKKETNRRSIHYVLSSRFGEIRDARRSLCCFFPLLRPIRPIPSLETLLNGMTRQTWVF